MLDKGMNFSLHRAFETPKRFKPTRKEELPTFTSLEKTSSIKSTSYSSGDSEKSTPERISQRTPKIALTLGRSAARSFTKRKVLLEKGQRLCIEMTSKMHSYLLNENINFLANEELEKLEQWIKKLESFRGT